MKDILNYLDNQINIFYQEHKNYPEKILLNKITYDKLFQELDNCGSALEGCWKDSKETYRGISLLIDEAIQFFRLE